MQRTRSETSGSTDPGTVNFKGVTDGELVVEDDYTVGQLSNSSKVITDVVTKNFRKRIAAGEIINNPVSIYEERRVSPGGGTTVNSKDQRVNTHTGHVYNFWMDYYAPYATFGSLVDDIDRAAIKAKCISNIDSSSFAFGEDLLETRETLRFFASGIAAVRNPAGALWQVVKKFMRKRDALIKRGLAATDAAANAYLTYRFAITPLVKSINDLQEYFVNPPKAPKSLRLTARSKGSYNGTETFRYANSSLSATKTSTKSVTYRASIMYEVKDPVYDARFHLGLRNKDIPATLWAVAPLSFMVDRIVDVSTMIQGLTNLADPTISILSACTSEEGTTSNVYTIDSIYSDAGTRTWDSVECDKVEKLYYSYNRTPWRPTAADTVPDLRPKGLVDDSIKIADLLTLIYVNLR